MNYIEVKQRHSIAGHVYNNVCGRGCYLIQKNRPWVRCECKKGLYKSVKKQIIIENG